MGVSNEFVESILSLISLLTSTPGGGAAIMGAGLIPLLVQLLDVKFAGRLTVSFHTTRVRILNNSTYLIARVQNNRLA